MPHGLLPHHVLPWRQLAVAAVRLADRRPASLLQQLVWLLGPLLVLVCALLLVKVTWVLVPALHVAWLQGYAAQLACCPVVSPCVAQLNPSTVNMLLRYAWLEQRTTCVRRCR